MCAHACGANCCKCARAQQSEPACKHHMPGQSFRIMHASALLLVTCATQMPARTGKPPGACIDQPCHAVDAWRHTGPLWSTIPCCRPALQQQCHARCWCLTAESLEQQRRTDSSACKRHACAYACALSCVRCMAYHDAACWPAGCGGAAGGQVGQLAPAGGRADGWAVGCQWGRCRRVEGCSAGSRLGRWSWEPWLDRRAAGQQPRCGRWHVRT